MCRHHWSRGVRGHAPSENFDILYRRSILWRKQLYILQCLPIWKNKHFFLKFYKLSTHKLSQSKKMKTMSLKRAFWRYLKRFGTAEKNENIVSKACVLTVFETIWNSREIDGNNVSKACILVVFETIWKKILRAMNLNGASLRYFVRYFELHTLNHSYRISTVIFSNSIISAASY